MTLTPEQIKIFKAKTLLAGISGKFEEARENTPSAQGGDHLKQLISNVEFLKGYNDSWAQDAANKEQVKASIQRLYDGAFAEITVLNLGDKGPKVVNLHKDTSTSSAESRLGGLEELGVTKSTAAANSAPVFEELRTALSNEDMLSGLAQMYADCGGDPAEFAKFTRDAGKKKIPIVEDGKKTGWVKG